MPVSTLNGGRRVGGAAAAPTGTPAAHLAVCASVQSATQRGTFARGATKHVLEGELDRRCVLGHASQGDGDRLWSVEQSTTDAGRMGPPLLGQRGHDEVVVFSAVLPVAPIDPAGKSVALAVSVREWPVPGSVTAHVRLFPWTLKARWYQVVEL